MRFAIVSDLHANLQAWNAVLLDIRSQRIDRIICLGDIVGYGPNPSEVLQSVNENVDHLVLGNHDAAVCGRMGTELFNDAARSLIDWTKGRLNHRACRFLGGLPLTLNAEQFKCAHGEFSNPAAFYYVIDPPDAQPSWRTVPHQFLFAGHTHRPGIFLLGQSGTPYHVPPQDFARETDKRYLVNVGSVGQPRDGGTRASYCIFDDGGQTVLWRRIPFDLDAYRAALRSKGVTEEASPFLLHDPRAAVPPLRDILSFSPASEPEKHARDTVAEQSIAMLRTQVSRWRKAAACGAAVALVVAVLIGVWSWRAATRERTLQGTPSVVLPVRRVSETVNLLADLHAPSPVNTVVDGWRIALGDKRHQTVRATSFDTDETVFEVISHRDAYALSIDGQELAVEPGMRFCLKATFRLSEDFAGNISTSVALTRARDDGISHDPNFKGKAPNLPRKGGWLAAQESFDIPAGATSIRAGIRGKFTGTVLVKDIHLARTR